MADVSVSVNDGSDNGLWQDDEEEENEQQMPSKEDVLQILLDLKGSKRSSIKVEHAANLRELFNIIQTFKATGGPSNGEKQEEDDDEKHRELWAEFEDRFDLDKDPFTSISTLELPPSSPSSSSSLLLSPDKLPTSTSNKDEPHENTLVNGSSSSSTFNEPVIPTSSRPATQPNGNSSTVVVPARVLLLPTPTPINPFTYCIPLSLISAPPPPPPEPEASETPEQKYDPPLTARAARIPLPLVSPYARTLYPIPVLPADGTRKSILKARKKGTSSTSGGMNGREGGGGQAPPADLFKWQATVNANPLSVMVRTAKKCLGSSDWETAYTELRFNRAMQRVEQLKSEGRWSFRQPKKQKGPPLAKSHWDWMLEEMKWLQTDFREERRWKVALAYEMSQWVLDWHDAKDKSEVCVRVGTGKFTSLSSSKEEGIDADGDAEMEEEQDGFGAGVSEERREVGEEENDDVEMDASKESAISSKKKIHHPSQFDGIDSTTANLIINSTTANDTTVLDEEPVDNLSATVESQAAVEEALDDLESKMTDEARDESDDPLHLAAAASSKKSAESNGVDGEGAVDEDEDADGDGEMDADGDGEVEMLDIIPEAVRSSTNPEITGEVNLGEIVPPELPIEDAKPLAPLKTANNDPLPPSSSNGGHPSSSSAAPALKAGSTNPTLTSNDGVQLVEADELDAEERLRAARSTLLQLSPTSLTFDLWAFSLPSSVPDQPQPHPDSSLENANLDEDPPSSDPLSIPSTSTLDAHLFSDLLGDVSTYSMPLPLSDSAILSGRIDRRIDEATVSGGKLAHTSRLLDIRPVLVSTLQPGKKRKGDEWEDLGDLWGANESGDYGEPRGEVVSWGTCSLFARKKSKESVHPPTCVKPSQPRNYEIRLSSTIWQNDDDIVLQRLCHQFPFNWQLISDAFNTSRRTLSIDRRSPWDCWQRWNKKWNPNPEKEVDKKDGATSEPGMVDGGEGGASSPGGTVLAAAAVSKKGEKGKMVPAILDPKFEGSKKKLRHAKLYEAMRKTAKRRDLTNRKPNLKEPRRVLTAHESHNQYISSRIGGPTPADLSQHKWERDKAYNEAQRAATEQRDIAFRRYQQGLANQQNQQGGSRQGGSGTPPGGQQGGQQQHQNQGNRPPGYQNGPNQQHSQLTPQQQQQFQQNAVHQQRLAALAASQNGGGGASNGSGGGVDRQLQLLQAQRNNQGRGPNQQQQQQHGQQQQQMHPSRAPGVGGGGPDRKSSRANSDSPSMQAAGISRPGSSGPGGGLSFQGARGDTPAEIAQSLVATVPAEICAKLDKVLTINGHSVTPQLIQAALANKVRNDAAAAQAAVMKAAGNAS